jgi:predicted Zn-dependent protease
VSAIASALPAGDNATAMAIAEFALAGEIALRRGRASEAVRQFRAATALRTDCSTPSRPPGTTRCGNRSARRCSRRNRPREAEEVYRRDLARFPNNGWSLYGLSRSLYRQGKITEARR